MSKKTTELILEKTQVDKGLYYNLPIIINLIKNDYNFLNSTNENTINKIIDTMLININNGNIDIKIKFLSTFQNITCNIEFINNDLESTKK